jgi:hypothetical protein
LKEGRWEWRREEEDKTGGKEKDRCPLTDKAVVNTKVDYRI